MEYVKLGRTGLEVSRICLGCMSYGERDRGGHPWALDEEAEPAVHPAGARSRDQLLRHGQRLLRRHERGDPRPGARRVRQPRRDRDRDQGPRPDARRPERRRPVAQGHPHRDRPQPAPPRHRLRRPVPDPPLGPRHADRGDPGGAARRRARPGKVRYIGASSMYAWQFAKTLYIADAHGWTRFVTMQNHYNLLYREEEREMLPLCARPGHRRDPVEPAGARPADPRLGRRRRTASRDRRVRQHGSTRRRTRRPQGRRARRPRWPRERGVPAGAGGAGLAAVASRSSPRRSSARPSCTTSTMRSPLVGLKLSDAEIASLEEPYLPHEIAGFA